MNIQKKILKTYLYKIEIFHEPRSTQKFETESLVNL